MDDKFWYLKNCDLFERLSSEQARQRESRCQARRFRRGELVYLPSDTSNSVFLLAAGRVKIYHITGDGKQALLAFIEPGEVIPGDALQQLMEVQPTVSLGVNRLLGLRRQRVERRLKSLLFRSNRERLVHLLLELVEKYGRTSPEGTVLGLRLSHQDLANMIGSTRETVTVVLGELQSEGALIIRRRQIVIKQLEQLAASVDVSPPAVPVEPPRRAPLPSTGTR